MLSILLLQFFCNGFTGSLNCKHIALSLDCKHIVSLQLQCFAMFCNVLQWFAMVCNGFTGSLDCKHIISLQLQNFFSCILYLALQTAPSQKSFCISYSFILYFSFFYLHFVFLIILFCISHSFIYILYFAFHQDSRKQSSLIYSSSF